LRKGLSFFVVEKAELLLNVIHQSRPFRVMPKVVTLLKATTVSPSTRDGGLYWKLGILFPTKIDRDLHTSTVL